MSPSAIKDKIKALLFRHPALFDLVYNTLARPHLEASVLLSILKQGDIVVDIGANTGQYSQLLGTPIGNTGSYFAFEPVPTAFDALEQNVASKKLPCHVFLHNVALSDHSGQVSMFIPNDDNTGASLVPHLSDWLKGEGRNQPQVTPVNGIEVRRLDDIADEIGLTNISLLKCDVEGAELSVLRGASYVLCQYKPILFIECYCPWMKDYSYGPDDLWQYLEELAGYEVWHIGENSISKVLRESPLPGIFPNFLNYLCVIPSLHTSRLKRAPIVLGQNG
jgi:FkbM family methyltransferase